MPIAPSFIDLVNQGEAELKNIRPDLAVLDGDVTLADIHAAGAMADAVIRFSAMAFKETFIGGAEGDALTTLVNDHLGIVRNPATFAEVSATFSRSATVLGGTIPIGTTIATMYDAAGRQVRFLTTAAQIVAIGQAGPWTLPATATVSGRAGRAEAGTITKIVDTLFDSTIVVNNLSRAAGGNEEESDDELRIRARAFFSTLRRGTLAALEFGALQVASVRVATATEDLTTGIVSVLIGDTDGNSSAQMIEDVEFELENWRAAGIVVNVLGGSRKAVTIEVTLTVRAGFSVAAVATKLSQVVIARGEKQKSGQTLFLDTIIATIISPFPDDIYDVTFNTITVDGNPVAIADVPASTGEIIRITGFSVV